MSPNADGTDRRWPLRRSGPVKPRESELRKRRSGDGGGKGIGEGVRPASSARTRQADPPGQRSEGQVIARGTYRAPRARQPDGPEELAA